MSYKKLLTAASLLALLPAVSHSAEAPLFPDLDTAKTAYKAQDYAKAAQHWMPLAHKGNDVAQLELGKLYSRGLGVVQRDSTALNLFMESAKQGNNRAMYEIGRAYESGAGVPRDPAKAKEWYSMAADAGYSRGNFAIGSLYEKNKLGTPKNIAPDTKTKLQTIVNDIKDGNFSQAEIIALAYEDNVSVLANPQTALTYYYLADKVGSASARLRIQTLEAQLSAKQKSEAKKQANLLFSPKDKAVRDERRTLINDLKSFKSPAEAPAVIETQKENALEYYEKASAQGYIRADKKVADLTGKDLPEYITPPKPPKKKYRLVNDLKTQYVAEENLDLGTRDNDFESSVVLNGKLGLYTYPTDDITTYTEIRGLHSDGSASSNDDDDDDVRDISFLEVRQAWVEFDNLLDIDGASAKVGRQRFYEPRGLWWNRDMDALKLSMNSTLTNGFVAVGQNLDQYRFGDDNDLERDNEDRLRLMGELSHQYQNKQFIEVRALYEDDHSGTPDIGANVPADDRDPEDNKLLWAGLRFKGQTDQNSPLLNKVGYRTDIIGVVGEVTTTDTDPLSDTQRTVASVDERDVAGWAFDGSLDFEFDTALNPTITVGYAYGSGDDGNGNDSAFRQSDLEGNTSIFPEDRVTSSLRNYGEVLRPELSNIHVATLGANIPVLNASDMSINYFSYWLDEETGRLRSSGISGALNGQDSHIGQGLDWMTNINLGKELRTNTPVLKDTALRLRLGGFKSGDAYGDAEGEYAFRGTSEVRVKF